MKEVLFRLRTEQGAKDFDLLRARLEADSDEETIRRALVIADMVTDRETFAKIIGEAIREKRF